MAVLSEILAEVAVKKFLCYALNLKEAEIKFIQSV